jgi:flagellar basal-body rod protein FlgB
MITPTSAAVATGLSLAIRPDVPGLFGPIDSLAGAMTYHRERNNVLVGNVTNMDTPGYRPADLRRVGAGEAGSLAVSQPGHITSGGTADGALVFDDGGNLAGPDGNAVALEREMAKIDANRVRYNTNAELVSRRLASLRYAATDGNG